MRINGPGRAVGPQSGAAARRASSAGAGFSVPSSAASPQRAGGPSPSPVLAGLDALIALQSVEEDLPRQRRRRTVRRGGEILDVLDELRIGLLGGSLSGTALDRVAALLVDREPSGDPGLDALMEDIALRAEVELAKQGRYLDRR